MTASSAIDLDAAAVLLAELRARGVYLEPRGPDRLRIGPPDLLDDDAIERARAAKPALLHILGTSASWSCVRCGRFRFSLPTVCWWCRRAEGRPARA